MKSTIAILSVLLFTGITTQAQNETTKTEFYKPNIHGTIRAKYEFQTEEEESRFEVRNARISADGNAVQNVSYKAEIDLSDEGKIKMLDAYARLHFGHGLQFTAGQFRVPFTIDAHRSPHLQYFANRSFIAKQMGSIRDVGVAVAYSVAAKHFPIKLEAGIFNGSGITEQQSSWKKTINFSLKAALAYKNNDDLYNLTLSVYKQRPATITALMYDAGAFYENKRLHAEVEYMYKHYSAHAFSEAHALNAFVSYTCPLRKCFFSKISPLIRFDYMTDNSEAKEFTDENAQFLSISDYERSRITVGTTLSIGKPFITDLRLNYENYFYRKNSTPAKSEQDKFVIELSTHF